MYKNIAFIPVRGGSKSIPLKNIKLLMGRPLVYWTLDAAVECKCIDKVFVSTDSDSIKDVVMKYGSDKIEIIGRSKETAEDTSTTESAMLEFADKFDFENIVLIQATSPLLTVNDISNGFKKFTNEKYDAVFSAVRQKRFIWEKGVDNSFYPKNYNPLSRPRRQEFEGYLVENGAFYITKKESLLESKCRMSGKFGVVEMSEESYFEIDEESDWVIIEELLRKRKSENFKYSDILKNIKMLITDSDGVLTDGGMYYSEKGDELKKFNTRDGMAFELLRENGIKTAIVTGEKVDMVKRRADKLKIDYVYLGAKDKLKIIREIADINNLELNEIVYIGDDINDLEAIQSVGFGCSVFDGVEKVKQASNYITNAKGGSGAVREITDLILRYRT
ncbi:acylneuraminate cytidylyltransferase [Clostridium beijerinckii]|uniref:acylneuraminate cytidylyltransferase n=1 Tax=Clostridium beijerinckii TaxID=1520 RepID=UPI00047A0CC7|nr:acylneuraminate cytidylyltransferase [Clostridium beijerinckii]